MKKYTLFLLVAVGLIGSASADIDNWTFGNGDLANGLVSFYSFNGNTLDSSGNGNDLITPNGISYAQGPSGRQAGVFNGSSTFAYISKALTTDNTYTWSFWFNVSDASQYQVIMNQGGALTGSSAVTPAIFLNDPNSITGIGAETFSLATGTQYTMSSTSISSAQWYNVVWTSLNGNRSLYINGNLSGTSSNQSLTEVWNNFYIGGTPQIAAYAPGGAGQFYQGLISDVAIWNTAFSSSQVSSLYNLQSAPEPSTYALFGIGALAMIVAYRRRIS